MMEAEKVESKVEKEESKEKIGDHSVVGEEGDEFYSLLQGPDEGDGLYPYPALTDTEEGHEADLKDFEEQERAADADSGDSNKENKNSTSKIKMPVVPHEPKQDENKDTEVIEDLNEEETEGHVLPPTNPRPDKEEEGPEVDLKDFEEKKRTTSGSSTKTSLKSPPAPPLPVKFVEKTFLSTTLPMVSRKTSTTELRFYSNQKPKPHPQQQKLSLWPKPMKIRTTYSDNNKENKNKMSHHRSKQGMNETFMMEDIYEEEGGHGLEDLEDFEDQELYLTAMCGGGSSIMGSPPSKLPVKYVDRAFLSTTLPMQGRKTATTEVRFYSNQKPKAEKLSLWPKPMMVRTTGSGGGDSKNKDKDNNSKIKMPHLPKQDKNEQTSDIDDDDEEEECYVLPKNPRPLHREKLEAFKYTPGFRAGPHSCYICAPVPEEAILLMQDKIGLTATQARRAGYLFLAYLKDQRHTEKVQEVMRYLQPDIFEGRHHGLSSRLNTKM